MTDQQKDSAKSSSFKKLSPFQPLCKKYQLSFLRRVTFKVQRHWLPMNTPGTTWCASTPGNWAAYGECLGLSPGLVTSTLRMSSAILLVSSSIPSMPRLGDIPNIDSDQLPDLNTVYIFTASRNSFWKDSKMKARFVSLDVGLED